MKKTKMISQNIKTEKTIDVLCNMCGNSCNNYKKSAAKNAEYSGLIESVVSGGYFSDRIGDMVSCRFSICEHCLVDKIFPKFKISPEWASEITDFVPEKEYLKKVKKNNTKTINEYIIKLKKLDPKLKRKELKKMKSSDLNKLFFKLSAKK